MSEKEGKTRPHWHRCPSCGDRSPACTLNCLAECRCLGRPTCPHWYCARCSGYVVIEHFVQPVTVAVEDGR